MGYLIGVVAGEGIAIVALACWQIVREQALVSRIENLERHIRLMQGSFK